MLSVFHKIWKKISSSALMTFSLSLLIVLVDRPLRLLCERVNGLCTDRERLMLYFGLLKFCGIRIFQLFLSPELCAANDRRPTAYVHWTEHFKLETEKHVKFKLIVAFKKVQIAFSKTFRPIVLNNNNNNIPADLSKLCRCLLSRHQMK